MALRTVTRALQRRRNVESSIGGLLFFAGAAVTVVGMLLPHAPLADTDGYFALAVAMAALGTALLLLPRRFAVITPPVAIVAAIAAATTALILNGERHGGPAVLNEFFYLWPVLYAGYFLRVRWTVLTLVAIGVTYTLTLTNIGLTGGVLVERVVVTTSVLGGSTLVMRSIRVHVDRLVSRLHHLARTDPLTGLLNRRAFDERLQDELRRSVRTGAPFSLLLGDVDHFKALNDAHGHAAGDQALVDVTSAMNELSRTIDTVARVGGEEFALLLPNTDLAGAVRAAERLRTGIAASTRGGHALTASFGAVEGIRHGITADELLRSADRALYAAKATGRDRTVALERATAAAA
jgi:diguanylate cyclase (GGDEF)-like protein